MKRLRLVLVVAATFAGALYLACRGDGSQNVGDGGVTDVPPAPPCPANCNAHGICSNGTCSCNQGYAGAGCETCAAGYSGYPACVKPQNPIGTRPSFAKPFPGSCDQPPVADTYTASSGHSYYVALSGSDTGDGAVDAPFPTIAQCAKVVKPGDSCVLRGGTYHELMIPDVIGTEQAPITFRAYPGEVATISAAEVIQGWSKYKSDNNGTIYRATMPWTLNNSADPKGFLAGNDLVFVDGQAMIEARWPNISGDLTRSGRTDWAKADGGSFDAGTHQGKYHHPDLGSLAEAAKVGAWITALGGALWSPASGKVSSATGNELTFEYGAGVNVSSSGDWAYAPKADTYFFLFGKLELLDAPGEWFRDDAGSLYLRTADGSNPSDHIVEAKRRDIAVDLRKSAHVRLIDLQVLGGRIETSNTSEGIVLDGVKLLNGTHALYVPDYWRGGPPAVGLKGPNSLLTHCWVAGGTFSGVGLDGQANKLMNSLVENHGHGGFNVFGAYARGSGSVVFGNKIDGLGSNGVLDLRGVEQAIASCNDVGNGGRLTADGGMVMIARASDGKGTRISRNYVHDGMGLSDNTKNFYGTTGIYSEGNVKNYIIDHNVIWNVSGIGIALGPGGEGAVTGFVIVNNVVDSSIAWAAQDFDFSGTQIRNNYFVKRLFGKLPANGMVLTDNAFQSSALNGNVQVAEPKLGEFLRPADDSPLIDLGAVIPPYTDGYKGKAPDIGAWEVR